MAWFRRAAAMAALGSALAGAAPGQDALLDLRVPVEFYLNGQVKTELFAERAVMLTNGTIQASGITFRFLTETGAEDAVIKAERCLLNQAEQTARSDSAVSLTRKAIRITGIGFEWQASVKLLKVLSEARVELARPALNKEGILKRARSE